MELNFTFLTIASAILKLFILVLVGYFLYHIKFIDDKFTDTLSLLLVCIIFPALIISKTISHFSFVDYPYWWFLPLYAVIFSLVGILIGRFSYTFLSNFNSQKEFISACGFQNCGYLPMNIILFTFQDALRDRFLIYIFLFVIGFNILMWSFMPLFLSGKWRDAFKLKVLFNPPVIAITFSLVWVWLFGKGTMPQILMAPLTQLGSSAFPLAMLTLGAYLCRYKAYSPNNKTALGLCTGIKLFLFPLIVLIVLYFIPLNLEYKFFLFLEAIMPVAVSLVIIGSFTGANNKFFSDIIFYSHLASFLSIPVWLAIFRLVFM